MFKKEKSLGERIKEARKKNNISARKLAELCEVSHTEINNIEKGARCKPALLTLKGFEKYLGIPFVETAKEVGYSNETIKYGEESIIVSYEMYDKVVANYKDEIEHLKNTIHQKRLLGRSIKESIDNILKDFDNEDDNYKKDIDTLYKCLEYLDNEYVSFKNEE